ncbi:MAG: hypothetical protein VB083_03315 [Aminobacterium sp.]|uniref:hypothetical protein n=1 Tax=Aminobacterium sp. TaxID=1872491 RepID=UPI002B1F828F|nr:hypothetical protein [Aminobacterium sp.]MEA4876918.1 hypothetical protein [Aminobacterium sp.]
MDVVNVFGGVHGSTSIGPVGIDKKPDLCPFCGLKIDACILQNSFCVDEGGEEIRVFFQCPNSGCTEIFIGYYKRHIGGKCYCLYDVKPKGYKKREFSEYIQSTSTTFTEIYNEASHAESLDLKQIVGPAYRKALEFLIKDYAISNNGDDDEEKIKGMSLTNCIKDYIEDSKAIDCAKRATWIGNEILHKQYLADMPYK